MNEPPFHIKIRLGDIEVEIGGSQREVMKTIKDLDKIVEKISSAFKQNLNTLKTTKDDKESISEDEYPKIQSTTKCSKAVISLLSAEWGEKPRAIGELREAMESNAIFFPKTTLSGVLVWLVKKGTLRRWKDKKRGYLYMLNEEKENS
jgi:hypothetical protein